MNDGAGYTMTFGSRQIREKLHGRLDVANMRTCKFHTAQADRAGTLIVVVLSGMAVLLLVALGI